MCRFGLVPLFIATAVAAPAHAEDTRTYVIQPGDSCLGIAIRQLGDRAAVRELHRLNPELGALPHHLAPGATLRLPAPAITAPDAHLTRARGDVKIRKPSDGAWDPARRGMELFRAYRVGAASQASAELRFADRGRLGMRERTIVVIYGPEKRLAKQIVATAELELGALESRLGELDGRAVVVRTPAMDADLGTGEVVIATHGGGPSVISNHGGAPVRLRGRTPRRTRGARVDVAAGMGTRVVPGRAPEPPRPLPPTPAWQSAAGPRLRDVDGTTRVQWQPVPGAARYRVAIYAPDGELVAAREPTTPEVRLSLDAGAYHVTVAALDTVGLESAPSPPLAVEVIAPVFVSPTGRRSAPGAGRPRVVVAGARIVAPAGTTCGQNGGPAVGTLVLERPGTTAIHCVTAAGERTPGVPLEVVARGEPIARR